jgi:hypothetical protein
MSRSSKRRARRTGVICVLADGTTTIVTHEEATHLCTNGHARWRRSNLIYLLKNLKPSHLSLQVGAEFALAAQYKESREWAQSGIQLIVGRKGVSH